MVAFHVYVFLLVVCLLLSLARLGRLCWCHLQPSHSRGGAIHSTAQRLLKPRTPPDCPDCRLSCAHLSVVEPAPTPVRPWSEVRSRRGAPKRINTQGFACPNQQCPYFGITAVHIHALVGDGKHGQAEPIQTFRGPACHTTFSARRHTPLYRLKTPSHQIAMVLTALAEGLDASASSGSRTCSWMNCAPGYAAPTRFSGSGWLSIPSPRLFLCLSSAHVPKPWPIGSSTRCDRS